MKRFATLVAALMAAAMVLANGPTRNSQYGSSHTWTINLGWAMPQGDHKDAGVDSMFMIGADYHLGMAGNGQTSTYAGVLGMWGSGNAGLDSRTWGAHYGAIIGMGGERGTSPLKLKLQGGYYNTELKVPGASVDDWGFGGIVALVWMPPRNNGGMSFSVEGGFYIMPEVSGANNNGWYIGIGIPIGGG